MPRRLLVVVIMDVQDAKYVRRLAGNDAEVLVVAPASGISRLDWLTNAEDDARAEARSLALLCHRRRRRLAHITLEASLESHFSSRAKPLPELLPA
jgi:hypothetical protein